MGVDEDSDRPRKRLNVTIREMDIDDLATVFHLGEKLFQAEQAPNLYRTWDEYEVIELFQSDPEFCFVAEVDDDIVGFLLGTTIEKSRSAWKYGQLTWLGVRPAFQGFGVAEKLFNRFRDRMAKSGVRILLVDTEADNTPALNFFKKIGFRNPEEHIYLALNIDAKQQPKKEQQKGSPVRRSQKNDV